MHSRKRKCENELIVELSEQSINELFVEIDVELLD